MICERAARSHIICAGEAASSVSASLSLHLPITQTGYKINGIKMSGMNRGLATCWTCLLLCAFLCEPVLSKGGRGGSRGSSRGSPSRSSTAGSYRGGGAHGGTRSRFRVAGRTSPVRVAGAAAAGAAVALTADKWYASAFRRSNTDSSEEQLDYYNRTNYFDALMSGSTQNGLSVAQLVSVIIATLSPNCGLLLDIMT